MRTRILNHLVNAEVEAYLKENDVVFIPVGATELHGGLPLDCETAISEAVAVRCAEKVNGLVLTGLGHFYAGATAMASGTIQISIPTGIRYLEEISQSLYEKGFRRQIYLSLHSPSYLTVSPVIRAFFDRTHCPILYIDSVKELANMNDGALFASEEDVFTTMIVGGYDILGRLEQVPLTSEVGDFSAKKPSSVGPYTDHIAQKAFISGGVGYYFGEHTDHMPTMRITSAEHRRELAQKGRQLIDDYVEFIDLPKTLEQLRSLDEWQNRTVIPKYPVVPNAAQRN